jgi:hypothetical protein
VQRHVDQPPLSLLRAEGPKRLFDAAGLGVINQRQSGCIATLYARKFLCRDRGALDRPAEPADDDENVDHKILLTLEVLLADGKMRPCREKEERERFSPGLPACDAQKRLRSGCFLHNLKPPGV